jgi:hypothetical protein
MVDFKSIIVDFKSTIVEFKSTIVDYSQLATVGVQLKLRPLDLQRRSLTIFHNMDLMDTKKLRSGIILMGVSALIPTILWLHLYSAGLVRPKRGEEGANFY